LIASVFVAHIIPLGYLLLLPTSMVWWNSQLSSTTDTLQIRFVLSGVKARPRPVATTIGRAKTTQSGMKKHLPIHAMIPQERSATQATFTMPRATPALVRQTAMARAPSEADYIPGGGTFQQRSEAQFGQQNARIPGDSFASHVPRFRMADTRMQGLGGVARAIGSMLGAVDPNCIDLDAWHGMTRAERIEHHLPTDETMQQIADKYHCIAPR
jgi:hypothetical protein